MEVGSTSIEELQEYERTANAFDRYYIKAMEECVTYRLGRIAALPANERQVYTTMLVPHLEKVEKCISLNANFLDMVGEFGHFYAAESGAPQELKTLPECAAHDDEGHTSRVFSTLRQVAREWSALGQKERGESFGLICAELESRFPDPISRSQVRVFVPGSGLGRLPFDIAMMGFDCIGNEYNMYMIFTGYVVQNFLKSANYLEIAPFVHNFSGNKRAANQLERVSIPDTCPLDILESSGSYRQSMGDFFSGNNTDEQQDVVATCFFLDAVPNILRCIKEITKIVKQGGLWINFGPMLWHYEHIRGENQNDENRGGLEMDFDTMIALIKTSGWEIEKQSTHKTTYCQNLADMLINQYTCEFFVARKTG